MNVWKLDQYNTVEKNKTQDLNVSAQSNDHVFLIADVNYYV